MGEAEINCLGPQSVALLQQIAQQLNAVKDLLGARTTEADMAEVQLTLTSSDALLGDLVRSSELVGCAAQHIENLRDSLGSHLIALAALRDAGIPPEGMLRRGVDAACSGVDALIRTGRACGHPAGAGECPLA